MNGKNTHMVARRYLTTGDSLVPPLSGSKLSPTFRNFAFLFQVLSSKGTRGIFRENILYRINSVLYTNPIQDKFSILASIYNKIKLI
jgi:hypothetical protein